MGLTRQGEDAGPDGRTGVSDSHGGQNSPENMSLIRPVSFPNVPVPRIS
jgi:hypothetical protein